jgi:cytosine/adenosine deaminase-related metal-dependent hydrolase
MAGPGSLLIRRAGVIYPCVDWGEQPVLDGWLHAEGPAITGLGPEPCPHVGADLVIDARGKVVIPGLVNVHHHFFQSITRAVPSGQRAFALGWLRAMYPLWQELDPAAIRAASRVAAAELLLTGATTGADFAYLYPGGQSELLDVEIEAVRELGLRLHLIRGCTPVLEGMIEQELRSLPGFDKIKLVETSAGIMAACESAIAKFHDPSRFAMCRVGIGPTAVPYRDRSLLEALVRLSEEAGVGRHTHLSSCPDEVSRCQDLHGCRPTEFLRGLGWLGERCWLAHCTMHTDDDIRVLAETGTGVAHCPSQNMRLGVPAGPIPRMREAGVRVGIGVDGAASNDGGSMLGELRLALMIHRLAGVHADFGPGQWFTPRDVLWMATRDGAAILGRDDIGRLQAGCAADIVIIDLEQIGYGGGLHDPLGTLLMAGDTTIVDTTIVNGQVVVRNGRLTCASERRLIADANRVAAAMVTRAFQRTGLDFGSLAPRLAPLMPEGEGRDRDG